MAQTQPGIGSSPLATMGGALGNRMQQLAGPPGANPPPGMQQNLMQQMAAGGGTKPWNVQGQPGGWGALQGMRPQQPMPAGMPGRGPGAGKAAGQQMPQAMKQQIAGLQGAPR